MPTVPFNFDATYLTLPDILYSLAEPTVLEAPQMVFLNTPLCDELGIQADKLESYLTDFPKGASTSFAQAYAGHQFGHFTMLGDGRAIVLGEHLTQDHRRVDIQVKGSGRTMFSRGGDGKATLKAMLREYLISEAMHHLNIPSSRSLAVVKTGQSVYRENIQEGAALLRVMKSHIRVGTFEFAARFGTPETLQTFTDYTISRLYPELQGQEFPALGLLNKVMEVQIALVAEWMRVGFIHGVMNTDNIAISGETFDFGPCAFINVYHPGTFFSSIDQNGRYAFGNQPLILKWNLARLAEAMLPLFHEKPEIALAMAQQAIDDYDTVWSNAYYKTMLKKIGIRQISTQACQLLDNLLEILQANELDYTNAFISLSDPSGTKDLLPEVSALTAWKEQWVQWIEHEGGKELAIQTMRENNPVYIPRNHLVEEVLEEAVKGNYVPFKELQAVLSTPYQFKAERIKYTQPPEQNFEHNYQTFCGT
jgi:uncharacterized protein YdiU (UPF0061 family)